MNSTLEKRIEVACSIEHAFSTFTQKVDLWWPRGHRKFKDSRLSLESSVGGCLVERSRAGEEFRIGEVLVWEPPERLSYAWYPGSPQSPTRVDIYFRAASAERTLVEVVHQEGASGLGDTWTDRVVLFNRGWTAVLDALALSVAGVQENERSDASEGEK